MYITQLNTKHYIAYRFPFFRYVQLMEKDVLKFGFSSREYVMLHDQSKEEQEEDPGLE